VLGSTGPDLRAVEGHMAELHQPGRPTQFEHLGEQVPQCLQVPPSERRDRAKIRPVQRRHRHEVDPLLAGLRDLARRIDPAAVGVEQKRNHHRRMVRWIAALLRVGRKDRSKIELLAHRLAHEMRYMPGRNQLIHRRWKQPVLLNIPRTKGLAHAAQ